MKQLLLLVFLFACCASTKAGNSDSTWNVIKPFLGTWEGIGGGMSGTGHYERSYSFVLSGQFIEVKNRSVYPPTAKNPKGEMHEDLGYFSYDKGRKTFVLRQFHSEGFVNQYKLESVSPDLTTIVFVTESIENIPKGWRARETYRIISPDEIHETFELAAPSGEFEPYSSVTLKRK